MGSEAEFDSMLGVGVTIQQLPENLCESADSFAVVRDALNQSPSVIPAKAGIQYLSIGWTPAFAGVTTYSAFP